MTDDFATTLHRLWSGSVAEVADELNIERWRIEEAFAYGSCQKLALFLNEEFGFPLVIASSGDNYSHAFCAIDNGHGLDIWGVRSFEKILSVWREDDDNPECRLIRTSVDDLVAMGGAEPEPMFDLVPEMLSRRLREAFAAKYGASAAQITI